MPDREHVGPVAIDAGVDRGLGRSRAFAFQHLAVDVHDQNLIGGKARAAGIAGRDQEPGRAIPITFSLGADLGLNVLADGFPASRPCGGGALEPIGSPGDSALQYDAGAQQYVIVWKTSRDWAGSCRELVVRLRDGSEQSVEVTFRATPTQGPPASPPGEDKDKEKGKGKPETPGHGHAP